MDQNSNFQAQFNPNQEEAYRLNPQSELPQESPAQQPNPYGMYQQNPPTNPYPYLPPPAYPSYTGQNAQPGYSQPYPSQNYQGQYQYLPGQYIAPGQIQAFNQANTIRDIETKIETDFCFYTCLVYFELVIATISLILNIILEITLAAPGFIFFTIAACIPMISACILALVAKANLEQPKQYQAYILFIISTIIGVVLNIVVLTIIGFNLSFITMIVQLLIGLTLIFGAHSLNQLMLNRNRLLQENRQAHFNPMYV